MTTPVTPCPHCGRQITYKLAEHALLCPANPANVAAYRAVMEDPANPGVLRIKPEYEAARGELWSGEYLMRTWHCGWGELAARFGLAPREAEPRKPIQWLDKTLRKEGPEIDAEIARNRATTAPGGRSGCRCCACGKSSTAAKFISIVRFDRGGSNGRCAVQPAMAGAGRSANGGALWPARPLCAADPGRLAGADSAPPRARAAHRGGAGRG